MDILLADTWPLTCNVVQHSDGQPTALVVLCHGYGADSGDLVGLAEALCSMAPAARNMRFVFPQAPLSLAQMGMPTSRAWWHLDPQALMARQREGELGMQQLRKESFAGLPSARRLLRATLDQALQQANLGYDRLILGGFSQGAMLTCDLALRLEEAVAALAVFSGTLIDEDNWRRYAARRAGLPVMLSHGRTDPILPYTNAVALRDMFVQAGCPIDFVAFEGGHTIPEPALRALSAMLERLPTASAV